MAARSEVVQVRATPAQKATLRRLARRAGLTLSESVTARALPSTSERFGEILDALGRGEDRSYALAELDDLLTGLRPSEFRDAVGSAELGNLSPLVRNYVAAMVEQAAHQKRVTPPSWTSRVPPLEEPYFATPLMGLRLHLLKESPVPFKRRNLFVDSGIGKRV